MLSGLAIQAVSGRAQAADYIFSKGALRSGEIFDSSTSPPARYIIEVARRLIEAAPKADLLVIANPLLPLKTQQISEWLPAPLAGPLLVSDQDNFPLLYCLPRQFVLEFERFLLTLSCVDSALDHRLIEVMTGMKAGLNRLRKLQIGPYPVSTPTGWFQGSERQKLLKITAANAIKIIEARRDWRDVKLAAYHPYHAGSIVFFAMASRDVATPLIERHVVCSSYRDIFAASGSRLEPVWLKLPYLPRDASVGEPQYFGHALDRLGDDVLADNFLIFMRYSRSTGFSPFHRIDQDRFSLGESFTDPAQLRQMRPPLVKDRCRLPPEPLRLLFHITGGLPIKNYPLDYCKVVMRALREFGVVPTVINRPDLEEYGAISIDADETDRLSDAVRAHHIFVGLDSFPHHFVKNVLGWPSIGMFGTTGAANFGGGWHEHYRALDENLSCHPCGAENSCPVFRGPECLNYVKPEALIAAIFAMAEQVYGWSPP